MNPHPFVQAITALWTLLVLYWLFAARSVKKTRHRESGRARLRYAFVCALIGFVVGSLPGLNRQLLPLNPATQTLGLCLCIAGLAFAVWARIIIGRNWSALVTVKEDHELIQQGPYRIVRHPIYTGLILAGAGTVLCLAPTARWLAILIVWLLAFYLKARDEERVMTQEFGDRYTQFKTRVRWAIIPFVL